MKRFYDSKCVGVTQPSQRKYVHYFSDLLAGRISLKTPYVQHMQSLMYMDMYIHVYMYMYMYMFLHIVCVKNVYNIVQHGTFP